MSDFPCNNVTQRHVSFQPDWSDMDMQMVSPLKKERQSVTPVSQRSNHNATLRQQHAQRPATSNNNYQYVGNSRATSRGGLANESFDQDELDSTDFDDLIFALKSSGNFTPSLHDDFADSLSRTADDTTGNNNTSYRETEEEDEDDETFPEPPPLEERYVTNTRRIRMGDTPL